MKYLLLLAWAAAPGMAAKPAGDFIEYTPPSRLFSCEIPAEGWNALEEEGPRGLSVHILGPEEPDRDFRAGLHVHYFEKGRPGFTPWQELLVKIRERDPEAHRESTGMVSWRIAKRPARTFEIRESRLLPLDRIPAELVTLHHFYALVPGGGDSYFLIKLSTTERTYLQYREPFKRFLKSFRIAGIES